MTPEPVDVIGRALLRDVPPHQLTQIMIDEAWSDAQAALDAITAAGWQLSHPDETRKMNEQLFELLAQSWSKQQPETD